MKKMLRALGLERSYELTNSRYVDNFRNQIVSSRSDAGKGIITTLQEDCPLSDRIFTELSAYLTPKRAEEHPNETRRIVANLAIHPKVLKNYLSSCSPQQGEDARRCIDKIVTSWDASSGSGVMAFMGLAAQGTNPAVEHLHLLSRLAETDVGLVSIEKHVQQNPKSFVDSILYRAGDKEKAVPPTMSLNCLTSLCEKSTIIGRLLINDEHVYRRITSSPAYTSAETRPKDNTTQRAVKYFNSTAKDYMTHTSSETTEVSESSQHRVSRNLGNK